MTTDLEIPLRMSLGMPVNDFDPLPSPIEHVRDGTVFIIERKTTSEDASLGSVFWTRKTLDVQPTMYLAAEPRAAFVLYDVIHKPDLSPLKATPVEKRKYTKAGALYAAQRDRDETPDEYFRRLCDHIAENPEKYFQRGIVVRMSEEHMASAVNLWHVSQEILFARKQGAWPQSPSSCFDYGSRCEFHDVCTGVTTINDDLRYETRPQKTRLPLLSASAVDVWGACHRKYFYAYELRRRPREKTDALTFGTMFHEALETWSLKGLQAALSLVSDDTYDAAKARALLLGYHARWISEPVRFEAIEKEFKAPLVHPVTGAVSKEFCLGGKMDGVAVKGNKNE